MTTSVKNQKKNLKRKMLRIKKAIDSTDERIKSISTKIKALNATMLKFKLESDNIPKSKLKETFICMGVDSTGLCDGYVDYDEIDDEFTPLREYYEDLMWKLEPIISELEDDLAYEVDTRQYHTDRLNAATDVLRSLCQPGLCDHSYAV